MTFAEALASALEGAGIRRAAWGPRRLLRLMPAPWNGEERMLMTDRLNKGDVPPYPYSLTGEDVRSDDWESQDEEHH